MNIACMAGPCKESPFFVQSIKTPKTFGICNPTQLEKNAVIIPNPNNQISLPIVLKNNLNELIFLIPSSSSLSSIILSSFALSFNSTIISFGILSYGSFNIVSLSISFSQIQSQF